MTFSNDHKSIMLFKENKDVKVDAASTDNMKLEMAYVNNNFLS